MERHTHCRGTIFWAREPDAHEWTLELNTDMPGCLNHCSLLPTVNVMGMPAASPCRNLAFRTAMDCNLESQAKYVLPPLSCSCQPCIFLPQQEMKLRQWQCVSNNQFQLPEGSCLGPIPHLGQTLGWHRLPENRDRGHGAHEIHPALRFGFSSKLHHCAHLLPPRSFLSLSLLLLPLQFLLGFSLAFASLCTLSTVNTPQWHCFPGILESNGRMGTRQQHQHPRSPSLLCPLKFTPPYNQSK